MPTTGTAAPAAWGLAVADDLVYLADRPACRVHATAPQAIGNGLQVLLDAPVEDYDTDGMHSVTANAGRLTVVTPGRYLIWATVEIDATEAAGPIGNRVARVAFELDGFAGQVARDTRPLTSDATPLRSSIAALVQLRPTQTAQVEAFQNSGGDGTALLVSFGALFLTR